MEDYETVSLFFLSGGGNSQPASCPASALIARFFIYVWVQLLALTRSRLIGNLTWLAFSDMRRLTTADALTSGSMGPWIGSNCVGLLSAASSSPADLVVIDPKLARLLDE
jgi:hypothetical protein